MAKTVASNISQSWVQTLTLSPTKLCELGKATYLPSPQFSHQ